MTNLGRSAARARVKTNNYQALTGKSAGKEEKNLLVHIANSPTNHETHKLKILLQGLERQLGITLLGIVSWHASAELSASGRDMTLMMYVEKYI